MHRLGLLGLTLLATFIAISATQSAHAQEVKQPQVENYLDQLSSCVALVMGTSRDGKPSVGTAFFLASEKTQYLITAGHVAETLDPNSQVTVRASGDKPRSFALSDLTGQLGTLKWHRSPDADLAILILQPRPAIGPYLQGHFAPLSLLTHQEIAPPRDAVLTVLGFPLALGVRESFSPISRETKAASGLLTIPQTGRTTTYFLTQDPSIGGFSGAPLFDLKVPVWTPPRSIQIRGGGPQIVGVAVATISDDTGGKLGVIVPAFYAWRILESLGETIPEVPPDPAAKAK
ncbi:MAG: trypsin-like peptidase domain-containing protein [Thermodesulfobacteriota bacterium]|jgi:hypothetical protein